MSEESAREIARLVPGNEDMVEVIRLSGVVARLEQELDLSRIQLRDAWARVPVNPDALKKPWRSDIAVTCRLCGNKTTWRSAKGHAEHPDGECPRVSHTPARVGVSDNTWAMLMGSDDEVAEGESLDDD